MRRLLVSGGIVAVAFVGQARAQDAELVSDLPGAGRAIAVEAYQARRALLAERLGSGVVVVPAAARRDLERDVAQDNDFRQDDYFFYLTGLESPDAWLLLEILGGAVTASTLFLPQTNPMMMRWTGIQLGPGERAATLTGLPRVEALSGESLSRALEGAVARSGAPAYTVLRRGAEQHRQIEEWSSNGRTLQDVRPLLDSLRTVKDSLGIAALRRAVTITGEGIIAGMRAARPGMYEYQLEATIEFTFRNLGADRMGFPSIVGSGPNSTTLHYDLSRRRMEDRDLVVVDVGAEYAMHTADITRTFPVSGRFTDRQRAIYELVLGAQQAVIARIEPGVTLAELTTVAREYLAEHGGNLCGDQTCDRYLVHGVSHWLGMRVHDVGDFRRPLEPGMVVTVEPGIYLPEEHLGVRIEDDVLVTQDGAEVLSAGTPKTVTAIERIMGSGNQRTDAQE